MLQGTGSDVGKSVLVAGLCRIFSNMGIKVCPFKPQNMSNNAAVAIEGGEIGRAQSLQAAACRVKPSVHMNPVLLKPQSNTGAQIIVHGKPRGTLLAQNFNTERISLLNEVMQSFECLKKQSDIVVVEGAGSPAEINLRNGDIANMGFAKPAGVPVILVGDIDRGGVIASLVGTKAVLDPSDAEMIKGFIINRFRGRVELFEDGYRAIERQTGWRGFGIVPWMAVARSLPAEDAVAEDLQKSGVITIAIPVMPAISNHDDFDALESEESVRLIRVRPGETLPAQARLVILPGSKATISDLMFFRAQGWDIDLLAHIRRGGFVLGICGGYQILGKTISDPNGEEGKAGVTKGLGLLNVHTVLNADKRVTEVSGVSLKYGDSFRGYEIHHGQTELESGVSAFLKLSTGELDGALSDNGRIAGCYIHRLFDAPEFRARLLGTLGAASSGFDQNERVETALDAIASELAAHLDIDSLLKVAKI